MTLRLHGQPSTLVALPSKSLYSPDAGRENASAVCIVRVYAAVHASTCYVQKSDGANLLMIRYFGALRCRPFP